MTRCYFDTNYLGKLQWQEAGSQEVTACTSAFVAIATAAHGRAEFYSIGHRKLREGTATAAILATVFAQFDAEVAEGTIILLPLTDSILDRV